MARLFHSSSVLYLCRVLLAIALAAPLAAAANDRQFGRRDIFSDIGNFFDGLEMQVDMDIFQPIENFFTTLGGDINQYVVMPAEQFFMQANTVVISSLYDISMFAGDIVKAIESAAIDEAVSVENLALKVGSAINSDVKTIVGDVQSEFNTVITPAFNQVGSDIGQAFNTAGQDILQGLEVAGNYIEQHPELIAEVLLTAVLIGVTVFQPELVAADGALIGEIALETASDTAATIATEIGTDAVTDGVADVVVDEAADQVISAADEPIYANIQQFLVENPAEEPIYANFQEILNAANEAGEVDPATLEEITEENFQDLEDLTEPFNQASNDIPETYANLRDILTYLEQAGKVVPMKKRHLDVHGQKKRTLLISSKSTSKSISTSKTSSSTPVVPTKVATTSHSTSKTSTSTSHVSHSTSKASTSTSHVTSKSLSTSKTILHSSTSTAPPKASVVSVPKPILQKWVTHHFLNKTTSGKAYTKFVLKNSLKGVLTSTSLNKTMLTSSIPNALTKMNLNIPYPPSPTAHRMAISHQIAMGNATAYNAHNVTVKIEMNPNAPVDVCLGVPKLPCYGNQLGRPYCLHDCASRWYNQMNVNPLHY